MAKRKVKCIKENNLLGYFFEYRSFINERGIEINQGLNSLMIESEVNARVKAQNSIEFKIEKYNREHNNGEEAINKCFNDLLGFRIIVKKEIDYLKIKEFLDNRFDNIICIDSSKGDYRATHIYFKLDNYSFRWELQIWAKEYEIINKESHERYKQDYIEWEEEKRRE